MSTNINLLSWREEANEKKKQQIFLFIAFCAGISLLLVLAVHGVFAQRKAHQDRLNDVLRIEITELNVKIVEIEHLQKEKEALLARMEVIQQLQNDRQSIVRLFDNIARVVPEELYLTSLNRTGIQLLIEGKAASNTRVSRFMRNIEASAWLSQPLLSLIQADDNEKNSHEIGFSLQAIQSAGKLGN